MDIQHFNLLLDAWFLLLKIDRKCMPDAVSDAAGLHLADDSRALGL